MMLSRNFQVRRQVALQKTVFNKLMTMTETQLNSFFVSVYPFLSAIRKTYSVMELKKIVRGLVDWIKVVC